MIWGPNWLSYIIGYREKRFWKGTLIAPDVHTEWILILADGNLMDISRRQKASKGQIIRKVFLPNTNNDENALFCDNKYACIDQEMQPMWTIQIPQDRIIFWR